MKQLAIVQLGDFHIKSGTEEVLGRAKAIATAVASLDAPQMEVVLAWTGDLAYSGKAEEFSAVDRFVNEVESALRDYDKISLLGSAFIPGNHDCDFTVLNDARLPLLRSVPEALTTLEPDGAIVGQISSVQDDFFRFLSGRGQKFPNRLLWNSEFPSSAGLVAIRCCNTAWMSQLHEQAGTLYYPPQLIQPAEAAVSISLIHHPLVWLAPDCSKLVRKALELDSDIILSGHEHDADTYIRDGINSSTNFIESSALYAAAGLSAFYVALFDPDKAAFQLYLYKWDKGLYRRISAVERPLTRHKRSVANAFMRSQGFDALLAEITTPFSHPRKSQLLLDELFVYPDIRAIDLSDEKNGMRSDRMVRSDDVLKELGAPQISHVSAPQGYGKTALGRMLCKDLLDELGVVPIYTNSDTFTSTEPGKIVPAIEQTFTDQYSSPLLEAWRQLTVARKAIIIDNWEKLKLNAKGKDTLLDFLSSKFGVIICFSDDSAFVRQRIEALVGSTDRQVPLRLYEINQFGYKLRGRLVTRWQTLGRELTVDSQELAHDISTSEKILDTLIGRGIVPSTPLFILSALQLQDDAASRGSLYGSYGHIYQQLITTRLSRVNPKGVQLKSQLLAALAYKMFETQTLHLSQVQVSEVHSGYQKDYSYTVDLAVTLREIAVSGLIAYEAGEVKFNYKYAYYFFVATALHGIIDDESNQSSARLKLSRLAQEAYYEDNANVLIFFLYLSKDRRLIQEILDNSRNIFAGVKPCDLQGDVEFVNEGMVLTPDIEEPSEDLAANVEAHREAKDGIVPRSQALLEKENSAHELGPQLEYALRSIEIMGQVLRNFPTNLKGDLKKSLVKESYALTFRTMGAFLAMLRKQSDILHDYIEHKLALETATLRKRDEKRMALLAKLGQYLAQIGIFGTIKKLSLAVGTEELVDTYDVVRQEAGETSIPTRLADLAIRLDHFDKIPEADIEDLERLLRSNRLCMTLLRLFVVEHMSLFPLSSRQRQRIVGILGLKPSTVFRPELKA